MLRQALPYLSFGLPGVPPYNPVVNTTGGYSGGQERTGTLTQDLSFIRDAYRWNRQVSAGRALERLQTVMDRCHRIDSYVHSGDLLQLQTLALGLRILTHYNFDIRPFMAQCVFALGMLNPTASLEHYPYNNRENLSGPDGRVQTDEVMLDRVIQGFKPAALIDRRFRRQVREAGLLFRTDEYFAKEIYVSHCIPARDFFDAESLKRNFSHIHPLVGQAVADRFRVMESYPLAVCLGRGMRRNVPSPIRNVAMHIFKGLFFGYPIEDVYSFASARFYHDDLGPPKPYATCLGVLEEWNGVRFKRLIWD